MNSKALIAIVDDHKGMREALEGVVESLGYGARCFASADDFLAADDRSTFACVILDVVMPGMSGLELQAKLVSEGKAPPIIILSSHSDDLTRRQSIAAGATCVLEKPVADDALISCIERALAALR